MTEELPPLVFLDMAAKGNDYADWSHVLVATANFSRLRNAIIAHARTLEITREALRLLRSIIEQCPEHIPITLLLEAKAFLAKHEPNIVPVDEDEEALMRVVQTMPSFRGYMLSEMQAYLWWPDFLAQFKAELAGRK
jgi:hypothetical protein